LPDVASFEPLSCVYAADMWSALFSARRRGHAARCGDRTSTDVGAAETSDAKQNAPGAWTRTEEPRAVPAQPAAPPDTAVPVGVALPAGVSSLWPVVGV
jgi:hypothetical protein